MSARSVLLPDPALQANLRRGREGLPEGRRSDRQGGADVRRLEAAGVRPLRRGLAGRRQRALPHRAAAPALQPHGGRRQVRRLPGQKTQALRSLLLQGPQLRETARKSTLAWTHKHTLQTHDQIATSRRGFRGADKHLNCDEAVVVVVTFDPKDRLHIFKVDII